MKQCLSSLFFFFSFYFKNYKIQYVCTSLSIIKGHGTFNHTVKFNAQYRSYCTYKMYVQHFKAIYENTYINVGYSLVGSYHHETLR